MDAANNLLFPLADAAGLWQSLLDLFSALWGIFVSLVQIAAPWVPLAFWIGFWLFAVNWVNLRKVMIEGGWIGVLLVAIVTVLIWGTVAPPQGGHHSMLGLSVSNYVGKFIYVTMLVCMMFLCGAVQLGGFLPSCCDFSAIEESAADEPSHDSH